MKKNKISKNWLHKQKKDHFFKRSKIQGFRSRSAFKLIEMNKKFKFLNNSFSLLDLGASPGGWSQVARKEIKLGKILAIDIKPMEEIKDVDFMQCDIANSKTLEKIFNHFNDKIDVVISDMAANTSGNKDLDSFRTGELCLQGMEIAKKILRHEGVFISKIFMGTIFKEIDKNAKKYFKKVVKYKPLSSKKESKEIYIFCKGVLKV